VISLSTGRKGEGLLWVAPACDAVVQRIVVSGPAGTLDVGPSEGLVTPTQLRALGARDRVA
jgi:hypothetical protein